MLIPKAGNLLCSFQDVRDIWKEPFPETPNLLGCIARAGALQLKKNLSSTVTIVFCRYWGVAAAT